MKITFDHSLCIIIASGKQDQGKVEPAKCRFRGNRTLNPELFAHSKSKEHWSKNILP